MNEETLRRLYDRLGIGTPEPELPPLLLPDPPHGPPAREPEPAPPPLEAVPAPAPLGGLLKKKVTISLPFLVLACALIGIGIYLASRAGTLKPAVPLAVQPPSLTPPPHPPPVDKPVLDPKRDPDPPPAVNPPPPPTLPNEVLPPLPPPPEPPSPESFAREHLRRARMGPARAAFLRKHGGTEASEAAVERGLMWLALHQEASGEWDGMNFNRKCPSAESCRDEAATGDSFYTTGVTGLAVLAFLGAGHTPTSGSHAATVNRAVNHLLTKQNAEGGLSTQAQVNLYNHSIAMWALCETFTLTGDERTGRAAERAIEFLERTQNPGGGWDYFPRSGSAPERNDASITGWAVLAIRSAQIAGLRVSPEMVAKAREFLVRRTDPQTGEVTYAEVAPGQNRRGLGLTAMGLFLRTILDAETPALRKPATVRLAAELPDLRKYQDVQARSARKEIPFGTEQNLYAWHAGTLAAFQVGGAPWEAWNGAVRDLLLRRQAEEGHRRGSWDAETSYIGREGGRVFATAINVLTLEIYYRYLPHVEAENGPSGPVETDRKIRALAFLTRGTPSEQIRAMADLAAPPPDAESFTRIADLLEDPDPRVRLGAVRILSAAGAETAMPRLIEAIRKESPFLKGTMLQWIARTRDKAALPLLLEGLEDSAPEVAEGALRGLRAFSGRELGRDPNAWKEWAERR